VPPTIGRFEGGAVQEAPTMLDPGDASIVDLYPLVRKIIGSRVRDQQVVDDLVQETLARVMAARERVEGDTLEPYAAVTARNLVASYVGRDARDRQRVHLLVDVEADDAPVEELLRSEESSLVATALARLPASDRELLVAHEVEGQATRSLAAQLDSSAGAVAAQLSRARARLRVEYLLAQERVEPPSDRCRPVLRALSGGDRRRQRELDTGGHLLECGSCARISFQLLDRRVGTASETGTKVRIARDADVVVARQKGRQVALELGFGSVDLTLIATAISEIARNIVKFADRGEMLISEVSEGQRRGITIVARDVGPGIKDLPRAMSDGFSTYEGLGLGLPGAKRLMDQFDIATEVGKGTTVTMTKWHTSAR
jgi:serine/threonine-protein kinase RsbT